MIWNGFTGGTIARDKKVESLRKVINKEMELKAATEQAEFALKQLKDVLGISA